MEWYREWRHYFGLDDSTYCYSLSFITFIVVTRERYDKLKKNTE